MADKVVVILLFSLVVVEVAIDSWVNANSVCPHEVVVVLLLFLVVVYVAIDMVSKDWVGDCGVAHQVVVVLFLLLIVVVMAIDCRVD